MSESISFEAPLDESNEESHFKKQDAIAIVGVTAFTLAGSVLVGTIIRKYVEHKAEQTLWTEATQDLDLHQ